MKKKIIMGIEDSIEILAVLKMEHHVLMAPVSFSSNCTFKHQDERTFGGQYCFDASQLLFCCFLMPNLNSQHWEVLNTSAFSSLGTIAVSQLGLPTSFINCIIFEYGSSCVHVLTCILHCTISHFFALKLVFLCSSFP